MKTITSLKIATLSILLVLATLLPACDALVEGINDDPNNPTTAPYGNILTGAQVGNIILQQGETARRAGIFCGYYTGIQRQHQGFNSYTLTTSDFDDLWEDTFVKTLRNAVVTQEFATAEGITGITIGIAQVLQAMAFGTAASLYGDVPFDEASLAFDNPAYEGQQQVYGKVQALLDAAIANLNAGTGRPSAGADIYFDGDAAAWIEVANTLKARYYMHTGEYANAFTAASAGISGLGNALYGPHGTGAEESNLNYQFFAVQVRAADLVTSDFMASLVDSDATTSANFANYRGNAKTNETGRYGFYFHTTSVGVQPNTTDGWAAQTAGSPLVTYEENLLILAEAGLRSQDFATGLGQLNTFRSFMAGGGYLTSADLANVQYDAYEAADFENGGMENAEGLSASDALLREILEERYVTLFGQIEGFNDTRRTYNQAAVRVAVPPNTGTELPQRFLYPQTEIDRNSSTPNPLPGLFDPTPVNQ